MFITDDPVADFLRYDAEQQKKLEHLPRCAICKEPIVQDMAVKIGNKWYCDPCLEDMKEYTGLEDSEY